MSEHASTSWRDIYRDGEYSHLVDEYRLTDCNGCTLLRATQPPGSYPHDPTSELWLGLKTSGFGTTSCNLGAGPFTARMRVGDILVRAGGLESTFAFDHTHTFIFASVRLDDWAMQLSEEAGLPKLALNRAASGVLRDTILASAVRAFWREAKFEGPSSGVLADAVSKYLVSALISRELTGTNKEQKSQLADWQINKVLRVIEERKGCNLSVGTLAEVARISKSRFAHAFTSTMGISPYLYVRKQRMEHVKRLLIDTDLPLEDVAEQSAYSSRSELSRAFGAVVGLTPCEFRRRHGIASRSNDN